jgi:polycystin 1L2
MSQINGFKGFVGYGIKELTKNETYQLCYKNISISKFPNILSQANFTRDFMLRSYSSGCYYFDTNTGKWYSNGIDVYEDTNLVQTHCMSNHLTSFAGGFVILPSKINIFYAFESPILARSLLAIIILFIVTLLYLLFAAWSHYMDIQDEKKINLVLTKDNLENNSYFYEVIVFTGTKKESGTQSKVNFNKFYSFLSGESNFTGSKF